MATFMYTTSRFWGALIAACRVWVAALLAFGPSLVAADGPGSSLRITEIMYSPPGGDSFEFLEIHNAGGGVADLTGLSISGVGYGFGTNRSLPANGFMVLIADANPGAFSNRYPTVAVGGIYPGRLADKGERIALIDRNGALLFAVTYNDKGFWPRAAAGGGASIEIVDEAGDPNDPSNWRGSTPGGSPGTAGAVPAPPEVVLNEILAGGSSVAGGLADSADWIELKNQADRTVSLAGWSLSDAGSEPRKFVFPPGASLSAGGFLRVWADSLSEPPGFHAGFRINGDGETVGLFDASSNRVDVVAFGPLPVGFSLARNGAAWDLGLPTPGTANQLAALGAPASLVLNEWLAATPGSSGDWVELFNRNPTAAVALRGLSIGSGGAPVRIQFRSYVGPAGYARIWLDGTVQAGHLDTKLSATGGQFLLLDSAGAIIDRVDYGAQSAGLSEGRSPDGAVTTARFEGGASPGASNTQDTDGDGTPDFWELRYGLDPRAPTDALADSDGDGASNLAEYLTGTDPKDPFSLFRVEASAVPGAVKLRFTGRVGGTYSLLRKDRVAGAAWVKVRDWFDLATDGVVEVQEGLALSSPEGFFAVTSPAIRVGSEAWVGQLSPSGTNSLARAVDPVRVDFLEPVEPVSIPTNAVLVTDDLGREVAGRVRFEAGYRAILFEPSLPWHHSTTYAVALAAGISNRLGSVLRQELRWSFATAPSPEMKDDRSTYTNAPLQLLEIAITPFLLPGGYTLADVNADDDAYDAYEPRIDVLLREGTFGAGLSSPNAIMRQRGQSVRESRQKSYRFVLSSSSPKWRGVPSLDLNKHPYDLTRVRNKLSFDLFKEVPHLSSLRSRFVRMSYDGASYGLFTQIEHVDRDFLKSHGLDADGQMYKAESFEFHRSPERFRLRSDPAYDEAEFNRGLEIRTSGDHAKLLRMLDDVNDESIPIDRVMAKHFNRDNYLSWLAVNTLLDNVDTSSRNFFLYTPSKESAWYFLPWDYDGAWDFFHQPDEAAVPSLSRWQEGIAVGWPSRLNQRFLKSPGNLEALIARVNTLAEGPLSRSRIEALMASYRPLTEPLVFSAPDVLHLPLLDSNRALAEYDGEYRRLPGIVEAKRAVFLNTLDRPMPIFLGDVEFEPETLAFYWERSHHLRGHPIAYDFAVSRTPAFRAEDLVVDRAGLTETVARVPLPLPPGRYYYRVIIRDTTNPSVNWQLPFDKYYDEAADKFYFGVRDFDLP